MCERMNAVLRSTFEKVCLDSDFALWGKKGLPEISTHFLNSTVTETNSSA